MPGFRMVYPSGEVETGLKTLTATIGERFRMVYPSGEVETHAADSLQLMGSAFRMVYPSGEVETRSQRTGVARPQGSEHHHNLHLFAQLRPSRGAQPFVSCVAIRTCSLRTREPPVLSVYPYFKIYAVIEFSIGAREPQGVVCRRPRGSGRGSRILPVMSSVERYDMICYLSRKGATGFGTAQERRQ